MCHAFYLIINVLNQKLEKLNINAIGVLNQLSNFYKVYLHDSKTKNTFAKTVEKTKEQREIIKTID